MLADLDLEYERERDRVSSAAMDSGLKARAIRRLEERYRERREPYIRHLTVIQDRGMR
jgi:hypothetical protein